MHDALYNLIRTHYRDLQGYVSAGMESGKDETRIFMNANENPHELPGLENFNRYPEPQPAKLLEGYAGLYGVTPDNIVATRGADEAIVVLSKLFLEPYQDSIIICPPTFGMYKVDAATMPAETIEIPLKKTEEGDFSLKTSHIIDAAKNPENHVKMIFLCSPNNPTGNSFDREDMIHICREVEGHAIVILDETYIEFSDAESLTGVLSEHPNLVILRTLSKSYALAGMRMGCLIAGDTDFIALIRSKCLDAYPLPKASIAAALKVMQPDNLKRAEENRAKLLAERDRLRNHFEASELVRHIYPSDANFLLIEMTGAKDFISYCAANNIILRDFSDKPGTKNCLRISPGLEEENDLLIKLLMSFEKQVEAGSAA